MIYYFGLSCVGAILSVGLLLVIFFANGAAGTRGQAQVGGITGTGI